MANHWSQVPCLENDGGIPHDGRARHETDIANYSEGGKYQCPLPYATGCHTDAWVFPLAEPLKRTVEEHLLMILLETLKVAPLSDFGNPWERDDLEGESIDALVNYAYTRRTYPYPDSLAKHAEKLRSQLGYLKQLVSQCQYYAKRTVFTTGLTEIALNLADLSPTKVGQPGLTLHPGNASMVPYMLQPPWLRINQSETIKEHESFCCPGHCMEPSCIQYCFNAMVEFVDRIHNPYTSLGRDQVAATLDPGCPGESHHFEYLGHRAPAYMMSTLILKRLLGPLTEFTNAITILARFCSCPSTLEKQAQLPKLPCSQHSPEGAAAWGIAYPAKEVN